MRAPRSAPLVAVLALGATLALSGCGEGGASEVGETIDQKTQDGADRIEEGAERAGDEAEELGDDAEQKTDD